MRAAEADETRRAIGMSMTQDPDAQIANIDAMNAVTATFEGI